MQKFASAFSVEIHEEESSSNVDSNSKFLAMTRITVYAIIMLLVLPVSVFPMDIRDAYKYILLIADVHSYYGTTCIIIVRSDSYTGECCSLFLKIVRVKVVDLTVTLELISSKRAINIGPLGFPRGILSSLKRRRQISENYRFRFRSNVPDLYMVPGLLSTGHLHHDRKLFRTVARGKEFPRLHHASIVRRYSRYKGDRG